MKVNMQVVAADGEHDAYFAALSETITSKFDTGSVSLSVSGNTPKEVRTRVSAMADALNSLALEPGYRFSISFPENMKPSEYKQHAEKTLANLLACGGK